MPEFAESVCLSEHGRVLVVIPVLSTQSYGDHGLLECCGKTLLSRAIITAKRTKCVDRVVVPSMDRSVCLHAQTHGALSFPAQTKVFKSLVGKAIRKVVKFGSYEPDIVMVLNWRTPLIDHHCLSEIVDAVFSGKGSSVVTVEAEEWVQTIVSVPETAEEQWSDAIFDEHDEDFSCIEAPLVRATWFCDWEESGHFRNGRILFFQIPKKLCLEIRTPEDLEKAEDLIGDKS